MRSRYEDPAKTPRLWKACAAMLSRDLIGVQMEGREMFATEPQQTPPPPPARPHAAKQTGLSWRGMFFTGLVLWVASIIVTALTSNPNLIPTVVLLGSFLVPATAVVWYVDHYHSPELT